MLPAGDATAFSANYAQIARDIASMTRTERMQESDFKPACLRIVGVDPIVDSELPTLMTRSFQAPSIGSSEQSHHYRALGEPALRSTEATRTAVLGATDAGGR